MVECTGPELCVKVCTKEKCPHSIGKRTMALLDWSILSGIVRASGEDQVSLFNEQVLHLWMVDELATLIEVHTFVQA